MRFFVIILLFLSGKALATNYYVSNAGSDAGAGTSSATAWQTISKVNTYSLSPGFAAGDTVFLKRGDVWIDSLRLYSGGSVGNPLVIAAYGTGAKPEITGFRTLTMTSAGGNLWTGTATLSVKRQNTVLLNDSIGIKARYPNSNVLTYTTATTAYLLIPHTATDYTGTELAINTATWEMNVTKVASHHSGATNDTLYYTEATTYPSGRGGTGYFFQNKAAYCDTLNEWAMDSATKTLTVYSAGSPTVKYSSIDTLVKIIGKSYITLTGVVFTGANLVSAYVQNARGISFDSCEIRNAGEGIYAQSTNGVAFKNGRIENSLNGALSSINDTAIVVSGNIINKIGIYPGMGKNMLNGLFLSSSGYSGILQRGNNFTISNNTITDVGYISVLFYGQFGLIENNFIQNYCTVKSDGGAIYTFIGGVASVADSGTVVKKNILLSTTASVKGVSSQLRAGIYLDSGPIAVTLDSNTIINQTTAAIYAKGLRNKIRYNTIFDTTAAYGYWVQGEGRDYFLHNTVYNHTSPVVHVGWYTDTTWQKIDSNRYYHFQNTSVYMMERFSFTVAAFKARCIEYDVNSTYTAPATTLGNTASILYNNTLQDSIYTVTGDYVDADGNLYHGAVYLKPFTSKILFPSSVIRQRLRRYGAGTLLFN